MKTITLTRTTTEPGRSSLAIEGNTLRIVGVLPHNCTIEPAGPNDAAALLFYADRRLKLAAGLADALRETLTRLDEFEDPDYFEHKRALERYDHLLHRLTS